MPTPDNPTNNNISAANAGPPGMPDMPAAGSAPTLAGADAPTSPTDMTLLVAHAADPAQRPVGRTTATMQTPPNLLKTIHEVADRAATSEARSASARADIESRKLYAPDRPMMRTTHEMRDQVPGLLRTIHAVAQAADRYEAAALAKRSVPSSGCGCAKPSLASREQLPSTMRETAPIEHVQGLRMAGEALDSGWGPFAAMYPAPPTAPTPLAWDEVRALVCPLQTAHTYEVLQAAEVMFVPTTQPYLGIPILNPDILFQAGGPVALPVQYNKCNLARDYFAKLRAWDLAADRLSKKPWSPQLAAELGAAQSALAVAASLLNKACGGEPIDFALFLCDDLPKDPDGLSRYYNRARNAFNETCRYDMVMLRLGADAREFLSKELFGGKPAPLVPEAGVDNDWSLWIGEDVKDEDVLRRAIYLCNLLWDRPGENSAIASLADLKKALQRMLVVAGCYDEPDSAKENGDWAEVDGIWLGRSRSAWNCWLNYDFDIKNKAHHYLGANVWTPVVPLKRPEPEGPLTPFDADEAKTNRPATKPSEVPAEGTPGEVLENGSEVPDIDKPIPNPSPNDDRRKGLSDESCHKHDSLFRKVWNEFKSDPETFCPCKINEQRLGAALKKKCDCRHLLDVMDVCLLKAMAFQEGGGRFWGKCGNPPYGDIFQVNNKGDWDEKKKYCGLTEHDGTPNGEIYDPRMTPEESLRAFLCWFCYKAQWIVQLPNGGYECKWKPIWPGTDSAGKPVRGAVYDYNGGGDPNYVDEVRKRYEEMVAAGGCD